MELSALSVPITHGYRKVPLRVASRAPRGTIDEAPLEGQNAACSGHWMPSSRRQESGGNVKLKSLILAALTLLTLSACGPGVVDGKYPIINGYYYYDAGGWNKTIVYIDAKNKMTMVLDARLDRYRVIGNTIVVAMRPVVDTNTNPIDVKVSNSCQHWLINTITHKVTKIDKSSAGNELSCRPQFYNAYDPSSP